MRNSVNLGRTVRSSLLLAWRHGHVRHVWPFGAKAAPSPEGSPAIQGYGMQYTTWRMPRDGPMRSAKPSILH
jgi:hypothetical protein